MSQPPQGRSGPGPGQDPSQNYPGQPAQGAYPPPPGYPNQPYGGPPPQGGYGGPGAPYGQAGPYGPGGPQPYGPGPYAQPPQQQPGKRRTGLFVLIGAGALALVLAVVAVAVNVGARSSSAGGGSNGGSGGGSAPAAATASDAVSGYLQAVATGDVATAISYAADPASVSTTYLTPEVLAASAKAAPMTGVQVTPVDDPAATTVPVSYRLGSTAVSTSIDVVHASDDTWKLATVATDVDLTAVQEDGVPMLMNGTKVEAGTFSLLPGSYHFTSGQRNFDYGSHPDLVVRYPSDEVDTSRVEAQVSSKGKAAALSALRTSWKSCLRSDDPKPGGCPNRWTDSTYKFKDGSVTWTRKGSDPVKKPLTQASATAVRYSVEVDLELKGRCTSNGRSGTCSGSLTGTALARADLSGSKVKLTWQT